jgi:hypothetical protein
MVWESNQFQLTVSSVSRKNRRDTINKGSRIRVERGNIYFEVVGKS